MWCMLLFPENVVEQDLGIDSLATKKMHPKIIGIQKKIHAIWLVSCCHSILQSS